MSYTELTEDQMVDELAEIQRLSRTMIKVGNTKPYKKHAHEKSVDALFKKLKTLARGGDVV